MSKQKILLENKEHGTSTEISIRGDIIQPGIFKDIKAKLCPCGGNCKCSELGHTHSSHHICTCKDTVGEEYAIVRGKEDDINSTEE